jgi:hypothetical protein
MTPTTWTERPLIPADMRVGSLRRGLLWTWGVIHVTFVGMVAAVYTAAEVSKNGDGFHDLGVLLGREILLGQVYDIWLLTTLASALVFSLIYLVLKERWKK